MAYTRIKQGAYLAIIDNQYMVEVVADTPGEALDGAIFLGKRANENGNNYSLSNISVCKIPSIICSIDWR